MSYKGVVNQHFRLTVLDIRRNDTENLSNISVACINSTDTGRSSKMPNGGEGGTRTPDPAIMSRVL